MQSIRHIHPTSVSRMSITERFITEAISVTQLPMKVRTAAVRMGELMVLRLRYEYNSCVADGMLVEGHAEERGVITSNGKDK